MFCFICLIFCFLSQPFVLYLYVYQYTSTAPAVSIYLGSECHCFGSEVAKFSIETQILPRKSRPDGNAEWNWMIRLTSSDCTTMILAVESWYWLLPFLSSQSWQRAGLSRQSRRSFVPRLTNYKLHIIVNAMGRTGSVRNLTHTRTEKKGPIGPGDWSSTPLGSSVSEMKEKRNQGGEKTVFLGQTS